jgi:hypothetical protein
MIQGVWFPLAVVGAGLVLLDWFLDQLLLAPVFCGWPDCAAASAALHLSAISSLVGIGCVLQITFKSRIPPRLLSVAAIGAFAVAILASLTRGFVLLAIIDVMLMLVVFGLLLTGRRDRLGGAGQRRY